MFHKRSSVINLIYSVQLQFSYKPFIFLQILLMKKEINPAELDFLLRFPVAQNTSCPGSAFTTLHFLPNLAIGPVS